MMQLVTHDGNFQADDVLAYAMLTFIFPDHTLIRTRDPKMIQPEANRIVFDVGGKYDPSLFLFDHHYSDKLLPHYIMNNGKEAFAPMAACGLIYKTFKKEIIESILKLNIQNNVNGDGDDTATVAKKQKQNIVDETFYDIIYINFIHDFDAVDNGVYNRGSVELTLEDAYNLQIALKGEKYNMYTNISALVNLFNYSKNDSTR